MEDIPTEIQKSPFRVRKGLEISRFDIKKPTVEGLEKLPPTPCVIATTHLSDIDIFEIATIVANRRKVGVASEATNFTVPLFQPYLAVVGKENFFPMVNAPYQDGKTALSLRFDDLKKMKEGIKNDGRTMIVAGHNPTRSWKLAESPGMTGVILAHMADVPLVPVALDIDSKTAIGQSTDIPTRIKNFIMFKRPNSKVIFGEPMNLAKIPEDKLQLAINLYSPDARRVMTPEQIAIATETLKILQEEASQIMEALASKLSPEKRGKWGKNLKEKQK
ncbi:MAG: hypothetical protein A3H17_00350 [Candidatus Levybacteria bacterium RIFCSPLOWO2_12_FULL_37_14]|nr:MAG: hypothetical protein US43_C0014G0025 [Candidatus Levybacteria bacterium GW2011_GWA1_37_16]KKQ40699.1 MAG: hypothetical protein US59_C0049G0006 [Candidatus Levybacteria bacterium GW2011_GWB1_37_8]OGH51569.1 MAG: hypothetical protein A3H17_00350 [Candidatus Levybacteria bacterium RIFCSPLOWO2_12_FULL_37_14]